MAIDAVSKEEDIANKAIAAKLEAAYNEKVKVFGDKEHNLSEVDNVNLDITEDGHRVEVQLMFETALTDKELTQNGKVKYHVFKDEKDPKKLIHLYMLLPPDVAVLNDFHVKVFLADNNRDCKIG